MPWRCVASPALSLGAFVDDRLVWVVGKHANEELERAKDVTKTFDDQCRWVWNVGKGVVFASDDDQANDAGARLVEVGAVSDSFDYLGVEYTM